MTQHITDTQLNNMTIPTIRYRHGQKELRRVLVVYAEQKKAKPLTLKGVLNFMRKPKQIAVSVGAVAMLAIAALSLNVTQQPRTANALEVAQAASQNLSQMSELEVSQMNPSELAYAKYYPLFVEWLKQAKQAPDLQILTYDELVVKYPHLNEVSPTHNPLLVIDNPRDGSVPDPQKLRYLEFTGNDNGLYKVAVGVNEHNIPEAALHSIIQTGSPSESN